MNHKIIILSFCATVLGSSSINAQETLKCPHPNDPATYQGWTHDTITPGVTWYAYDAWVAQEKYDVQHQAQCNYINNKDETKKITFLKTIVPGTYKFRGTSYLKDSNAECTPWKFGQRVENMFPPECDFVPTPVGAHENPMHQEIKIHIEESGKYNLQNQKK